jgi:uroporphyrinogen decarboxylase
MYDNIPIRNPKPDRERFIDYLMGRTQGKAPMVEYLIDDALRESIGTDMLGHTWVSNPAESRSAHEAHLANHIDFWYRMGYDFVRFEQGLPMPRFSKSAADTADGAVGVRNWVDQHHGSIESWDDFERYPWPDASAFDYSTFEYLSQHLPEGLGLIVSHGGGPFEHLSSILSLEGMCFLLHDDPKLVKAVADKIGGAMAMFYEHLSGLDNIIAVFQGDDMGHKTGTMIHPNDLREYCLPWHKRFAEIAHAHGLPYFLHSCGNMVELMEDLIEDVKLDGKHSFEDIIIPVEDFQEQYGDRLAVLGGMDIDRLAAGTPEQLREHSRYLMDRCGPRGRFALGSGSSIANYIPVENYLAMLDEALA